MILVKENKSTKLLYLIIINLLFIIPQYAQSFKSINKLANTYFISNEFEKALPLFLRMDSISPGSGELNYRIGICYLKSPHKSKALSYLVKAKELNYDSPGLPFNLAIAYHSNENFQEAIKLFNGIKLRDGNKIESKRLKEINRWINICNTAIKLKENPLEVKIENLGSNVNSPCPEYAPVISGNEEKLIFTSKRPCQGDNKKITINEDIYISEQDSLKAWKPSLPLSSNVNTSGHDASVSLSADGQNLLIYRDTGNGDIYYSNLQGANWTKPLPLPKGINSLSWEPSAAYSPDGNTLFIVSTRAGGVGGMDIYMSSKSDSGKWSPLKNLGPTINTEYDEDAPFFHPNGTLYFSSNGHHSMGGFDIFSSQYFEDSSKWTLPNNIGYPINTVNDDIFFVWSSDGKRGYFSSDRSGGYGDKDLYVVHRPEVNVSLISLNGIILSAINKEPIKAKITITDNEQNKIIGDYHSNSSTGKYSLFIKPGGNYGIAVEAEGFLPHSENIDIKDSSYLEISKVITLQPINTGNGIVLQNVFFDSGKSDLKKESFIELNKIVKFLKSHPSIHVEIGGHTDNVGDAFDNQKLSESRSKEVVKYLREKGINPLRLKAIGYGENKPIYPNETEDGRKANRRTELIIINN